ncbi:F-box protein: endocytic membrane traffic, recycling ReCYcling 1 [Dispira parvispora]|uniref:F-box protein: endocytic membrane traffic, recycling ReCYcling 1 n=1 Tax=Dispira parvispora TaxID=1520584 RepID=A0A9W8AUZ9_9FUNG|nr:F-box protein: endocytic membrane traffic, recycling ReCYcling 1 [Dispira parvispora]
MQSTSPTTGSPPPKAAGKPRGIQPYTRTEIPVKPRSSGPAAYAGKVTQTLSSALQLAGAPLALAVTRIPLPFTLRGFGQSVGRPTQPTKDLTEHGPLLALPDTVLLEILQYLSISDVFRVCSTCRYLLPLAYQPALYLQRLVRMGFLLYMENESLGLAKATMVKAHRRAQQRRRKHSRNVTKDTPFALVNHLEAPPSMVRLLQRVFQWPDQESAPPKLVTRFEVQSTVGKSAHKTMSMVDLVTNYLNHEPMQVFKVIYTYLIPFYTRYRTPQGYNQRYSPTSLIHSKESSILDPTTLATDLDQALLLDQLGWFARVGVVNDANWLNSQLESDILCFTNLHLDGFQRAYYAGQISGMQYHASVMQLLRDGTPCVQQVVDNHPFFRPFVNSSAMETLFKSAPPTIFASSNNPRSGQQWCQFLAELLTHVRDFAELVAVVFPDPAPALSHFSERILKTYVAPTLLSVLRQEELVHTPAQWLETATDMVCQCLNWIDDIHGLPDVELLVGYTQEVLFRQCEPLVRDQLRLEKELMDRNNTKLINAWKQKERSTGLPQPSPAGDTVVPPLGKYHDRNHLMSVKQDALTTLEKSLKPIPAATAIPELKVVNSPESSDHQASAKDAVTNPDQSPPSLPEPSTQETTVESATPVAPPLRRQRSSGLLPTLGLDKGFSNFLSLDLAITMIHTNKEAIGRTSIFWLDAPDDWKPKQDVLECIEYLFVSLLRHLGRDHITTAFTTAISQLARVQPLHQEKVNYSQSLAALSQFLELIHLADLIIQMIEVYHKQELLVFIDEHDFLSTCNQEKKALEVNVDDHTAAGLDRVIDIMMAQVEHLLQVQQLPTDFNPKNPEESHELRPTAACTQVLDCLSRYTSLVSQGADKNIVEVFLGEVGLRLFHALGEHIRRFRIAMGSGGFQLISDLNAYHHWSSQYLKTPDVVRYFDVLKELGNLYIVTPQHLRELLHDTPRFEPVFRVEEIYEFVMLRADYTHIKGMVEERCGFM